MQLLYGQTNHTNVNAAAGALGWRSHAVLMPTLAMAASGCRVDARAGLLTLPPYRALCTLLIPCTTLSTPLCALRGPEPAGELACWGAPLLGRESE